jgi:hypothetical protein
LLGAAGDDAGKLGGLSRNKETALEVMTTTQRFSKKKKNKKKEKKRRQGKKSERRRWEMCRMA